jgi:DNA-binding MurR/RpiR family transcriptional regulator
MDGQSVIFKIKQSFEELPDQMKLAATAVIENPTEVALLSMRGLAKQAGVPAATMTRLAQRLGYAGYEELRAAFAADLRGEPLSFSGRTKDMLSRRQEVGEKGLASDLASVIAESVFRLSETRTHERLVFATELISTANRVYCCGSRSSFPAAFLFSYLQGYFWDRACLLDGLGGAGADPLLRATPDDVLFAVSFAPYARITVELVRRAKSMGVKIVAITDQEMGSIGSQSDVAIVVSNHSPSFFDTMVPAFAAVEVLAAMVAGRLGPGAATRVQEREALIATSGVWEAKSSLFTGRANRTPLKGKRGIA